jgi:hypothetical protein
MHMHMHYAHDAHAHAHAHTNVHAHAHMAIGRKATESRRQLVRERRAVAVYVPHGHGRVVCYMPLRARTKPKPPIQPLISFHDL